MDHAAHVVGCVPYVNALPLIARADDAGVQVVYDVPSRLPDLLDQGRAEAVLVSSYEALAGLQRTVVDGLCIGSFGPVQSVKLVSTKPWTQVKTLALDRSSMTSNALARIILRSQWEAAPATTLLPPDEEVMLAACDACVLIGDNGMMAGRTAPYVIDLGEAWTEMTGLPFVWAMWTGLADLTRGAAAAVLSASLPAFRHGQPRPTDPDVQTATALAMETVDWPEEVVVEYLTKCMRYPLDELAWKGLAAFSVLLVEHRLARQVGMPVRVSADGWVGVS